MPRIVVWQGSTGKLKSQPGDGGYNRLSGRCILEGLQWDMFDSPFGSMLATADGNGLRILMRYTSSSARHLPAGVSERSPEAFTALREQLAAYFDGRLQEFDLRLNPQGTDFQQSVWRKVQAVAWGRTSSYLEIARQIDNPKAIRAVGHANGRNPIHIIIPCHRIIGTDGSLRGYAGGLEMKRRLLELEGHRPEGQQVRMFD